MKIILCCNRENMELITGKADNKLQISFSVSNQEEKHIRQLIVMCTLKIYQTPVWPEVIINGSADFDYAVGLDAYRGAGLDILEELVAEGVDNGHFGVRPYVAEDRAAGRQRVDGL